MSLCCTRPLGKAWLLGLSVSVCLILPIAVPAQRLGPSSRSSAPTNVEQALAEYEAAGDKLAAERRQAISHLGRFQDPRVTKILLDELAAAGQQTLQRTVAQALGQRQRPGALEALIQVFEARTTSYSVRYAAAPGIARQGDAGVDYLLAKMKELRGGKATGARASMRNAVLSGLSSAKSERAANALAEEAMQGTDAQRYSVLQRLRRVAPTPKLTAARLKAARSSYTSLAIQGVLQLAEHGHEQAKPLALELLKRNKNSRTSSFYMASLAEALAALLDADTYEGFLLAAAAAGSRAKTAVEKVRQEIDTHPGFVDWLLTKGLRLDNVHARLIAVQLLTRATDERITPRLQKLALGKEPGLARQAIQALGERGDNAAADTLRQVLRSKSKGRKLDAIHSLHALSKDDPKWQSDLRAMLNSGNEDQKVVALDLLASYQDQSLLPSVYMALKHKSWRVRAAAMDFCRKVRNKGSIPHLIACLEKSKGRLFADCQLALKAHTGFRLHTVQSWRDWWAGEKDTFKLPPLEAVQEKERTGPVRVSTVTISYFNIPLVSNRVIFVLDVSGSMSSPMGGRAGRGGGTGTPRGGRAATQRTRLEEAKVQLKRVINALPEAARFNLIYFDTPVNTFLARMALARKGIKQRAIRSVQALQPRGGTNIHDALWEAFQDPGVDTIYLLSDGAPSAGKITDPDGIAREVARWNQSRRIRIHTISLGSKSDLMVRLARESGGQHVWVQ
jgi:HEAT repeat protein